LAYIFVIKRDGFPNTAYTRKRTMVIACCGEKILKNWLSCKSTNYIRIRIMFKEIMDVN